MWKCQLSVSVCKQCSSFVVQSCVKVQKIASPNYKISRARNWITIRFWQSNSNDWLQQMSMRMPCVQQTKRTEIIMSSISDCKTWHILYDTKPFPEFASDLIHKKAGIQSQVVDSIIHNIEISHQRFL